MLSAQHPLAQECELQARSAAAAARELAIASRAQKDAWLLASADSILQRSNEILEANHIDLDRAREAGLSRAMIDRLTLDDGRIAGLARTLREVAGLPDPIGETIRGERRPNGLEVRQIRVPLGVVFMIYESRPNVTIDAAAICVKSGNAVILRGGKEAGETNRKLMAILSEGLVAGGLPKGSASLVESADRESVRHFLRMPALIDLVIPRGGEELIRRVAAEAQMPVLKHYRGNCHVYVDASADLAMAVQIVVNAKTQRPGVCNAAESLLVHAEVADQFLPLAVRELAARGVELRGDARARVYAPAIAPATEDDWDAEYLDLILSVAVVDSLDDAIAHINAHGSRHTDAIVTSDLASAQRFCLCVDSSAVVVNASTRFNDGGELGLGAEIGISTDKFHARGPCGLRELTTTKWIVEGAGQVRT